MCQQKTRGSAREIPGMSQQDKGKYQKDAAGIYTI